MNQILLIQVDGKVPNLALMKLSRYHKMLGDNVNLIRGFKIPTLLQFVPDKVYISCIFEENYNVAMQLVKQFPNSDVYIGGTGVDLTLCLSDEVEHLMPDYDLFECDYSIGFTSRGCIRTCPFCVVPKKEGYIKAVADICEFLDPRHKHIVLLDNNILALPEHFKHIAKQIKDKKLTVDFNQGLDIRLVNDENADILSNLRIKPSLRFSWDNIAIESKVRKGINILQNVGIKQSFWYVLVGYDSTFDEDLYRLNILKELGQRAYVMRYSSVRGIREYNDLAAWSNQPWIFSKYSFEEFKVIRHKRKNKGEIIK